MIQGNLDPGVLLADPEVIRAKTREMIDIVGIDRYVVNLGHGMWPEHNPEHLGTFVDEVHVHSAKKIALWKSNKICLFLSFFWTFLI